jgi:protein-disulfide isomerase
MKAGAYMAGATRRSEYLTSRSAALVMATVIFIFGALVTLAPATVEAAEASANPIVATIGNYQITQREVDTAALKNISPNQLYDLRKETLDKMVDSHLIDEAAKKAKMTPAAYLERETHGKVTEADARKYYDAHKKGIDAQTHGRSFDEIKPLLMSAMQRHQDRERRDTLMAKLRADAHVKVMLKAPRVKVVSTGHPWVGGKNAPVTIVEFSDFQCPYCRSAEPVLKRIRAKYGDKIKLVYMDFPLGMHAHAMDAAVAGRCAADQKKFWQLHDAMFANQSKLDPADLQASAAKAGLDKKKFDACLKAKTGIAGIKADQAEGERLGVTGTPTFFVNGRELVGVESEKNFSNVIEEELARATGSEKEAAAH